MLISTSWGRRPTPQLVGSSRLYLHSGSDMTSLYHPIFPPPRFPRLATCMRLNRHLRFLFSFSSPAFTSCSNVEHTMSMKDPIEKDQSITQEYLQQDELPDVISARKKEAALVRKLDRFVAPVMMLLMLISYLDRGNIGFAATQGMTRDIGLKGSQLNVAYSCLMNSLLVAHKTLISMQTAVSVFYIFYIIAEVCAPAFINWRRKVCDRAH
jgi:hypothetical protein